MLKLAFPVPFQSNSWTAEIPYGTIERPTNGNEEPVLQWVDISGSGQGVAIANDCKYSCSAEPGEIRYTILRSPPYAADYHSKGYDYSRHEFTDQGYQTFSFAVIPHKGNWRDSRVIETAGQLNNPPNMLIQTLHKGKLPVSMSFITVRGPGVYIQAMKESENRKGFIVRAAEWFGKREKSYFHIPSLDRKWSSQFEKYEIKTFFISVNISKPVEEVSMLELENKEL